MDQLMDKLLWAVASGAGTLSGVLLRGHISLRDRVLTLEAQDEPRNTLISKMDQAQKATDAHVARLDITIELLKRMEEQSHEQTIKLIEKLESLPRIEESLKHMDESLGTMVTKAEFISERESINRRVSILEDRR